MNVEDALDRLDAIQEQLSRSSPVRGYRAVTVGWTALLGSSGAALQVAFVENPLADRRAYLTLWVGLALVGILAMAADIARRFALSSSRHERHGLLRTALTLLPAFGTAAVLTVALAGRSGEVFGLLPGLWMLCFALAIFASITRLPPGVGYVGCLYFAAGAWALGADAAVALSPWVMGGVFGIGQAWATWILARNPETFEFPLERGSAT